jgi:mRNA-degrading endonuclease YafQ of YafQ-DinJ toxin-antitoxin module
MKWEPKDADKNAAWDLYVELLTRITTQPLPKEHGDEQTALNSVFALFTLTRDVLKKHGRNAEEFSKIAIVVLNQVIRPFTAKWHKHSLAGAFDDEKQCNEFRTDLKKLQLILGIYTQMLSDMAGVEDLTKLEDI